MPTINSSKVSSGNSAHFRTIPCLIAAILAFAALDAAVYADNAEEGAPTAIWDFGFVSQKSEVSHAFYLHNTGTADLVVSKIKPGCSCTSVSKVDKPIAPGDSIAIVVTFKSGRYHRKVHKTTRVYGSDAETLAAKFQIRAYVIKEGTEIDGALVEPIKLTCKAGKKTATELADSLRLANPGSDTLMIAALMLPGEINRFAPPARLAPGESAWVPLHGTVDRETGWLSLTIGFIGSDTTIVTVPIEIED